MIEGLGGLGCAVDVEPAWQSSKPERIPGQRMSRHRTADFRLVQVLIKQRQPPSWVPQVLDSCAITQGLSWEIRMQPRLTGVLANHSGSFVDNASVAQEAHDGASVVKLMRFT